MTKPPKVLYVGPTDYLIKLKTRLDLLGETDSNESMIYLRRKQSDSTMRGTLVHELMHAIIFESGIAKVMSWNNETEEEFVSVVSPWVQAVIQDNPALLDYLHGEEAA